MAGHCAAAEVLANGLVHLRYHNMVLDHVVYLILDYFYSVLYP